MKDYISTRKLSVLCGLIFSSKYNLKGTKKGLPSWNFLSYTMALLLTPYKSRNASFFLHYRTLCHKPEILLLWITYARIDVKVFSRDEFTSRKKIQSTKLVHNFLKVCGKILKGSIVLRNTIYILEMYILESVSLWKLQYSSKIFYGKFTMTSNFLDKYR